MADNNSTRFCENAAEDINGLKIRFYRSHRVPDHPIKSEQPIVIGPLSRSSKPYMLFKENLDSHRGRTFLLAVDPSGRNSDGLAIQIGSENTNVECEVRILAGKVNVASGPKGNDDDCFIVPPTQWIDGVQNSSGQLRTVRQFVTTDFSGHSIASMKGPESPKTFHFEIRTPVAPLTPTIEDKYEYRPGCPEVEFPIKVRKLTGETISLRVHAKASVEDVKYLISQQNGMPRDQQRLIYNGRQLENCRLLEDYSIKEDHILHLVERLRGGGVIVNEQVEVWPGGLIAEQIVRPDPMSRASRAVCAKVAKLTVEIVTSKEFEERTSGCHMAPAPDLEREPPEWEMENRHGPIPPDDIDSLAQNIKINDQGGLYVRKG